jgi:hypothetical protein
MTASQTRTRGSAAKAAAAKAAEEKANPTPKTEGKPVKEKKAPKDPTPTYREVAGFQDAVKAAKSSAKGNADLVTALNLVTHFGWKTPGGTVGWAKGTSPKVVAASDDLLVPSGTPIPDAMNAVLAAATKAADSDEQKATVKGLKDIVAGHKGA